MYITDEICRKYVDCSGCVNYQKHMFKFRTYPRGTFIPRERCTRNIIYFILEGEVWVNSDEHPDTILREGQFIIQPMGSRVEFRVHSSVECVMYLFDRIQNVCEERYQRGMDYIAHQATHPAVMRFCTPLHAFLEGMKMYLSDNLLCSGFLQAKRSELFFLLSCYYPIEEIMDFYSSVYNYSRSFQYFVLNNYRKVKDVEEFAQLGGYTVPTFRRLFKDTFDEPVYQWILKQKKQDVHDDLVSSDLAIKEISSKYGFESLANFSHFCKANFGKSPRAIRAD